MSRIRRRLLSVGTVAMGLGLLPSAAPMALAEAPLRHATLRARALLPAEAMAAGPWTAAPNLEPDLSGPGGRQPVGGFSALISDREGRWWAMPDNGFASKANSRSFLLRLYHLNLAWKTAAGGSGRVSVRRFITLSDPRHYISWPIVTQGTGRRLLTGADFDIESVRIAHDGTWWFGDEYGPFLLHADANGRLLQAPVPTPEVVSPKSPLLPRGSTPNLRNSGGFEGMALSPDGRYLYPTLEAPLRTQNRLERTMLQYDVRNRSWTGRSYTYPVTQQGISVSDVSSLDARRLVVLERDSSQGAGTRWKRVFVVNLATADPGGRLTKRQVLDLLDIADPAGISLPARLGDLGLGRRFTFPYSTVEAVLPLGADRLAVVNDSNFGSKGRNPQLPDYSDFIQLSVPRLGD